MQTSSKMDNLSNINTTDDIGKSNLKVHEKSKNSLKKIFKNFISSCKIGKKEKVTKIKNNEKMYNVNVTPMAKNRRRSLLPNFFKRRNCDDEANKIEIKRIHDKELHGDDNDPRYSKLNNSFNQVNDDWRNVVRKPIRTEGKKVILDEIMSSVKHSKKSNTSVDDSQILTRRVKRTIKNLFNITPKLHKNFKRGLYVVSLVHQKGKVLVTSEDVLPTIEIQCEQTPSPITIKSDFYWLSKVICNWSNVKPLKNIFEKPSSITDSMHFRCCLLHSIYQMQKTVGFDDLGNLHYQLLSDPRSTSQIFLLVKNLPDDIRITSSLKWGSVSKLIKKRANSFDRYDEKLDFKSMDVQTDSNMMSYITANIPDLVTFNTSCVTKLPRGLYIGYVKLTSFIDQLTIFVPENLSNVFPFVQIRENPKVLSEEWNSLINLSLTPAKFIQTEFEHQNSFINLLYESSINLMQNVGVPVEEYHEHRLYTNEVFEFSNDVSFILLMPNFKQVCSGLGEEEKVVPGYISLPLQQFEIYHMRTYHPDLTKRYALLSTLLEAEVSVSSHLVRQGVSNDDEMKLRDEIQRLNQQQKKLDDAWKSMRWIAEVIGNARDSKSQSCLSLDCLKSKLQIDLNNNNNISNNISNNSSISSCNKSNLTCSSPSSSITQMSY